MNDDRNADEQDAKPPKLPPEAYPPYVTTSEQRYRWELCNALASRLMEGAPDEAAGIWMTARTLYHSDMET